MFWTLGFRGRPAIPLMTVLEELIDTSSVGGAVFDLGSATYDLTRIVTGQLDAYLDVGTRIDRGGAGAPGAVRGGRGRRRPQQLALRPRRGGALRSRRPARS